MDRKNIIIMGAAGRDFHDFNVYFRDNPNNGNVVAFTATQIPDIGGRRYPPELANAFYPEGIPIHAEEELPELIKKRDVDTVVFSYSDVSHEEVMHKASVALTAGANFELLSPEKTYIKTKKPVISVCAVRTGCGKSQTSRKIVELLKGKGKNVVAIRHPMPYGDLAKQAVQRFATLDDLKKHECTIEEIEEYEPYIARNLVVYAGVDYGAILEHAIRTDNPDIILWDGGNNDVPFYKSTTKHKHIVVADPHRAGHETRYHPGELNLRMADVIIINKMDSATQAKVDQLEENIEKVNPKATIIIANSKITVEDKKIIKGKQVIVVEDGPTVTHGGMPYGAGYLAAEQFSAKEVIDPRPFAVGTIKETFQKYPHLTQVLPAMGYGKKQIQELEQTINASDADMVVIGTPIDLGRLIKINKPCVRATYDLEEIGKPNLETVLQEFF